MATLALPAFAGSAHAGTIVSMTFDDDRATQYQALAPLQGHGMRATFYVNSGLTSTTTGWHMSWGQLSDLAAAGNEIGGHTLTHADLTQLDSAGQTHEVCDDRQNLLAHGFSPVISFAYPYSAVNDTAKQTVRSCGYLSARAGGGIKSLTTCTSCAPAETVPPLDLFKLRTPDFYKPAIPLSTMQAYVTQAENNGGGWVILGFHDICRDSSCDPDNAYVTPTDFAAFLDWLQPRAASGTVVRTVGEVISPSSSGGTGGGTPPPPADTSAPTTTMSCNGGGCGGRLRAPATVTLLATDTGGSGVRETRYTTDGSDPAGSTGQVYAGPFTLTRTTTVRYRSVDNAGNQEATRSQTVKLR